MKKQGVVYRRGQWRIVAFPKRWLHGSCYFLIEFPNCFQTMILIQVWIDIEITLFRSCHLFMKIFDLTWYEEEFFQINQGYYYNLGLSKPENLPEKFHDSVIFDRLTFDCVSRMVCIDSDNLEIYKIRRILRRTLTSSVEDVRIVKDIDFSFPQVSIVDEFSGSSWWRNNASVRSLIFRRSLQSENPL